MSGVTSQGFESKQYATIVDDLATNAKAPENFGEQFPVTPDSGFGVLAGIIAAALKDQWDLAEAVANQGNRDKAEGKYLEDLAALIGLTRLTASQSSGNVIFTGDDGTLVPSQTAIKSTSNQESVLTQNDVTLTRSACWRSTFSITSVNVGEIYSVDVNGANYETTAVLGQTASQIVVILANLIASGGGGLYTGQALSNTIIVTSSSTNNNVLTTNTANINLVSVSTLIPTVAVSSGAIPFYAGTLTILVTPIAGITFVNTLTDFSLGRDLETDADLRVRMEEREQSTGTATKPSIEASLSDVEGVSFAYVVENTTFAADVDGRPPKSYETYVSGGSDNSIAEVIWETKPAGIELWGDTSVIVVDHNGDDQLVKFSRFANKSAWVRLTYSINSEEEFFPDGEQLMKDAVVETGNSFYRGEDLEPTKFYGNIYKNVSGVYISKIEVAITDLPTDTPTYSTSRISVNNITNLIFSTDRVPVIT